MPKVFEGLQCHLLRRGRVACVPFEECFAILQRSMNRRIQGIELLIESQSVKLFSSFQDGLGDGSSYAPALIPQECQQSYGRSTHFLRDVEKGGHVERREDHRQADYYHDARPYHMPRADGQVEL